MPQALFKGIIAYPITPFDGKTDGLAAVLRASIDRLVADGASTSSRRSAAPAKALI